MKNLIIIIAMFIFASSAFCAVSNIKTTRAAMKYNASQHDGLFVAAPPSAHYRVATSSSFDPFASKANKYAESNIISVISDKAVLVKFSADGSSVATSDAEYFIPASTRSNIVVDESYPYVRIISTDGNSAVVYVTEVK